MPIKVGWVAPVGAAVAVATGVAVEVAVAVPVAVGDGDWANPTDAERIMPAMAAPIDDTETSLRRFVNIRFLRTIVYSY